MLALLISVQLSRLTGSADAMLVKPNTAQKMAANKLLFGMSKSFKESSRLDVFPIKMPRTQENS